MDIARTYLEPTQEAGRDFMMRGISGGLVMLNLLRFRVPWPTTRPAPTRAPKSQFRVRRRIDSTSNIPVRIWRSRVELFSFFGRGGRFLIGPSDERWDAAMLVRQESTAAFEAFASNREYLAGMGHRVAALEDSRLLPLVESKS